MKAKEFLISYLEKETDFYNSEKVDGYGVMKVDNFVSVIEQYANQRVIEEFKYLEDKSDAYREEYITSKITSCNEKKQ